MLALTHLLALTHSGSHRLAGASHVPFCDGGWFCINKLRRDGVIDPKSVTVTLAPHHKKLQLQFEGAAQGTETCFDRSQCLQSSSGSGGIDSSLSALRVLYRLLVRLCWQMLPPQQSLHRYHSRLCWHDANAHVMERTGIKSRVLNCDYAHHLYGTCIKNRAFQLNHRTRPDTRPP